MILSFASGAFRSRVGSAVFFFVMSCLTAPGSGLSAPKAQPAAKVAPSGGEAPRGKPQVFQRVVLTSDGQGHDHGYQQWTVELRTASEIWCERQCSKFELKEIASDGFTDLLAVKIPVTGNTTPGMLSIKKKLKIDRVHGETQKKPGKRVQHEKFRILNVGRIGLTVTLDDVIAQGQENFYAVPMLVSSKIQGSQMIFSGVFDGRTIALNIDALDRETLASLQGDKPVSAFVMGSLMQKSDELGKPNERMIVSQVIAPWTED